MQNSLFSQLGQKVHEHTRKAKRTKISRSKQAWGKNPLFTHHTEAFTGVGCRGEQKADSAGFKGSHTPLLQPDQ